MQTLHFPSKSRIAGCSLALALVGAMSSMTPVVAQAQGMALLTCEGRDSSTFSPGLTSLPQTVTATRNDTFACANLISNHPQLTGGIDRVVSKQQLSCSEQVGAGVENRTLSIQWNDGTTSTFVFTLAVVVQNVDGSTTTTETGSVQSGSFAGNGATLVTNIATNLLSNCSTGQISAAGGEILTIL